MEQIYYLYKIINQDNRKIYIGQTIEPTKRWNQHKRNAVSKNPQQIISLAIAKCGVDNFIFEILACCKNQDDTNYLETELVKQYDSFINNGKGYNVTFGGMNAPKSDEWKKHMSIVMTGKPVSQEVREKIRNKLLGRSLSKETKSKISFILSGRPGHSKGKPSPNKGKTASEETKKKQSLAKIGKSLTNSGQFKKGQPAPNKGKEKSTNFGQTWKLIDGKRVYYKGELV
jgi:group I intron endonuclease